METRALKVALIVGSTRPNRFADVPAAWVVEGAKERAEFQVEVLDLRDWDMPFYEEPQTAYFTGGAFTNPIAERWRHKIGEFDAFLVTAAEYNHGPTAVLKNAFDSASLEWGQKPIAFIGYGGVGGARAVEQLRANAIELRMAPIKHAVHIGMEPFVGVLMQGKALNDYDHLANSRTAMFDELVWWGRALRAARSTDDSAIAKAA